MAIQATVTLTGPIAPTSTGDTYPVFDTTYGLDGLRNVNTLTDRNNIPDDRRRAGMLVGVSGTSGTEYYTLLKAPWTGTDSDWVKLNTGGNTITGFTFNPSNYDISIGIEDTAAFTQNLGILATDVTITSGSYNPTNGVVTFSSNTTNSLSGLNYLGNWSPLSSYTTYDAVTYAGNGLDYFTLNTTVGPSPTAPTGDTANWIPLSQRNVFTVSGFTTGYTDTKISGGSYSNGTLIINQSDGSSPQITGITTYSVSNGITSGGTTNVNFKLGGSLIEDTTIASNSKVLTITGSGNTAGGANTNLYVSNDVTSGNPSAIFGNSNGTAIFGTGGLIGIYGSSSAGNGVKANSTSSTALLASSTSGTAANFQIFNSPNNTIRPIITLDRFCLGPSTGNTGIGGSIDINVADSFGNSNAALRLITKWTNAEQSARTSNFEVYTTLNASNARKLALEGNGQLILDRYGVATFAGSPTYLLGSNATGGTVEFTGGTNRIPFFNSSSQITTNSDFRYIQGVAGTGTLTLPPTFPTINFGEGRVLVYSPGIPTGLYLELAGNAGTPGTPSQNPDISKIFWFRNKAHNTHLIMGHNSAPNAKFSSGQFITFSSAYARFGGGLVVNFPSAVGAPINANVPPSHVLTFWGTQGAAFNVLGTTYTDAAASTVSPATRSDIVINSFQTPTISANTTLITSTQNYTTVSSYLMYYSATTAGAIQSVTIGDSLLSSFYNASLFALPTLGTSAVGTTSILLETYSATSSGYRSISYSQAVAQTGATDAGFFTGVTTGSTIYYTGVTTGVTYNSLSNVYISGAPVKTKNVFGDTFALRVNSGSTYLGENLVVNGAGGSRSLSSWLTNGPSLDVKAATFIDTTSTSFAQSTAFNTFAIPTFAASLPTEYTEISNVYIQGPPNLSTNVSVDINTSATYSLRIEKGPSNFGGRLVVWPYVPVFGKLIPTMPSDNRTKGLIFSVGRNKGLIDYDSTDTGIVYDPLYLSNFSQEQISSDVGTVSTPIKYQSISTVHIEGPPSLDETVSAQTLYPLYIASGASHMGYGFSVSLSSSNTMAGKVTLPGSGLNRVLVTNPLVTTDSIVMLTRQSGGVTTAPVYVDTLTNGSFYIRSSNTSDTGVIGYMIINRED